MGSYVPATKTEQEKMLSCLDMQSMEELYAVVPDAVRIKELQLPTGLSEWEVVEKMSAMANRNTIYQSIFRGAGAYHHYIPSIVKSVTAKEEFVTAYTPYQAEISQGVLQSIFEYQTQICELTGMDVSNASVYDGGVAAAEAVFMCQERRRSGVIISQAADPQVIAIIRTYCESRDVPVTMLPTSEYATSAEDLKALLTDSTACVYVQSPNYFGVIEDMAALTAATHEAGAKLIMGVNPISLGLLKTPGEYGVDIAVGEGQPLGLPMSFGGPYLGFMACKQALMRKLPGRIVGETSDAKGQRAFVLTLQAREQHIRREKASSNICSNEALCAMCASVYLAAVGPKGLRQVAVNCSAHAHYLAKRLAEIPGFALRYDKPFFHEFVTDCPLDAQMLCQELSKHHILGGLPMDGGMLWCCTECNSRTEIDALISVLKEVCAK